MAVYHFVSISGMLDGFHAALYDTEAAGCMWLPILAPVD